MAAEAEDIEIPSITLPDQVFDVQFHPHNDIVATALITGQLNLFSYSREGHRSVMEMQYHDGSCRAVQFSTDGRLLYTVSSDRSFATVDLSTSSILQRMPDAHPNPINCMTLYSESLMCTGDDEGEIKVWDIRSSTPVMTFSLDEHTDFVSDLCPQADRNILLSTGGDGALCAWDMRKGKLQVMSEQIEDELLSLVVMKRGKKVVCGSQEGVLNIFSWGLFGDVTDRFPGHPNSVDALLKIDEDTLLTGSSDGLIRVVQIQPNSLLGVLGEHEDECPIEQLALSRDKLFVASCSHDQTVKFWSATDLFEGDGTENAEAMSDEEEQEEEVLSGEDFGDADSDMEDENVAAEAAAVDSDQSDEEPFEDSDDSDSDADRRPVVRNKPNKPSMADKKYQKTNFFSGL